MSATRRSLIAALPALIGCGARLRRFPFDDGVAPSDDGLQITYFSVGCFRLRWRGIALLTDPFWSHLPFGQVAFGRTDSDPAQVDAYLPGLSEVVAVMVGHAHYDHVLDLPYVAPHLSRGAQIFGSQTLAHTLAPLNLPLQFRPVNTQLATPERAGVWQTIADGRVRILPIASGHPNNSAFVHLWQDRLTTDRTEAPTRAVHFQEGETLAWLVDFLDGDTIAHRVYIQTSSRGWPDGFFPAELLNEREVDVALLAMDCANIEASGRDSIIDFLQPETVIFCHWERFFRPKSRTPREIVKVNLPKLHRWFEADPRAAWRFPGWDTHYTFPDPGSK